MGSTKRLNNCFATDNKNNLCFRVSDIDITQNIAIAGEERRVTLPITWIQRLKKHVLVYSSCGRILGNLPCKKIDVNINS